jgi:CRP-like cAMP-binding protein
MTNAPRAASVEAVLPCRLLECSSAAWETLTAQFPQCRVQLEARAGQYDSP